jgi:hypothetical protein
MAILRCSLWDSKYISMIKSYCQPHILVQDKPSQLSNLCFVVLVSVRILWRAGFGSHGRLQGLGSHREPWAMQAGGLSEHDALKTATILGAEAIGLEKNGSPIGLPVDGSRSAAADVTVGAGPLCIVITTRRVTGARG